MRCTKKCPESCLEPVLAAPISSVIQLQAFWKLWLTGSKHRYGCCKYTQTWTITLTELVLGDDLKGMHAERSAGELAWHSAAQGGLVDEGRVQTQVHGRGAIAEMELAKYNVDAGVQKYKERQEHLLKALEKGLITPDQYLAAQATTNS
jgi:hypothetical protein